MFFLLLCYKVGKEHKSLAYYDNKMETRRFIFYGEYLQCPECGASKKYRRYYDTFTRSFVADECGACFRSSCGYDLKPSEYYKTHPDERVKTPSTWTPPPPPPIAYIPARYATDPQAKPPFRSNLLLWLQGMFTMESITKVVQMYHIGENRQGWTQWPYIDTAGRINEIKLQDHNPGNGHRLKWSCRTIHKELRELGILDANTRHGTCLFGEHLLTNPDPSKYVCIVESEKTCIMMAMAMPNDVWLATGGSSSIYLLRNVAKQLNKFKMTIIYPDAGEYTEWSEKAKTFGLTNYIVSRICEGHSANTDIADIYVSEWLTKPTAPSSAKTPSPTPSTIRVQTTRTMPPISATPTPTTNTPTPPSTAGTLTAGMPTARTTSPKPTPTETTPSTPTIPSTPTPTDNKQEATEVAVTAYCPAHRLQMMMRESEAIKELVTALCPVEVEDDFVPL